MQVWSLCTFADSLQSENCKLAYPGLYELVSVKHFVSFFL